MEKEKCPNLMSIYDHNDTHLYARDPNQTLPECPTISSPAHKTCNVCRFQANVVIACSEDVGKLEVEASDGSQILNISPVCKYAVNVLDTNLLLSVIHCYLLCYWSLVTFSRRFNRCFSSVKMAMSHCARTPDYTSL